MGIKQFVSVGKDFSMHWTVSSSGYLVSSFLFFSSLFSPSCLIPHRLEVCHFSIYGNSRNSLLVLLNDSNLLLPARAIHQSSIICKISQEQK